MVALTKKQSDILNFIVICNNENGYPPSRNEICEHFGFASLNSVICHLKGIEKKGHIVLDSRKARGIHIASGVVSEGNSIPVLGDIAAGLPVWSEQEVSERIPVQPKFFGNGEMFALRVKGDSMTGVGILDGDIAFIRKQTSVENGEIAAVCIDNETTLKRFYRNKSKIVLKAENPKYQDMEFDIVNAVLVIGKLTGILRKGQP